MAGRRRGVRWHARKPLRIGPYFRNYSATVDAAGARARFTSHGFRFPTPLGPLTINLTNRTWTLDHRGRGAVSGSWGKGRTR